MLGDPCVFKKVLPDGRLILVCVYVDDIVYAVPDDSCAADFLTMIRDRFVVEEGEGKPVEFLLGMAGTISVDMSMAIDKLARGILTQEELVKSRGVHYTCFLLRCLVYLFVKCLHLILTFFQCLVRCCIFLIAFGLI